MVLSEGKRDNQLLPFLEIYKQKTNKEISLGDFKSMMLKKLSFEGGIRNVSLQSNYYLVGAVRYYFEGLLTINKNLSIFEENATSDEWNIPICEKVNALILVLRNGYIDNIGKEWLEPEDFGSLSLKDLFKKYAKEIKKVLLAIKKTAATETPEEEVKDYEMKNPNYTYDIIYNFSDSSKYENATSPGSWCITYGMNHLSSYCSWGHGHFVIFRKNGFENVKRKPQREMWIVGQTSLPKPQDEYGNSLIAFLQSNNNPGPANYNGAPLITSRWNHGSEFSVEADKAYTFKEFKKITGVTDADLKGIYETWLREKDNRRSSGGAKGADKFKATIDEIRTLKYIQMRINGGENPAQLLKHYDANKPCCICEVFMESTNRDIEVLVSGRNIFFETISGNNELLHSTDISDVVDMYRIGSYELGTQREFYFNKRTKNIIYVGDQFKFKAAYDRRLPSNDYYVEVKLTNKNIALIDAATGNPLKLPNGQYWFNQIIAEMRRSPEHGEVYGNCLSKENVVEIVYDLSSRERYFFDTEKKRFYDFGQNNFTPQRYIKMYQYMHLGRGFIGIIESATPDSWGGRPSDKNYLYYNGEPYECVFTLDGIKYKYGEFGPNDAVVIKFRDTYPEYRCPLFTTKAISETGCIVDVLARKVLTSPISEENARVLGFEWGNNLEVSAPIIQIPNLNDPSKRERFWYDTNKHSFLKNPYKYPSEYLFISSKYYHGYGNKIEVLIKYIAPYNGDWDRWKKDKEINSRIFDTKTRKFYFYSGVLNPTALDNGYFINESVLLEGKRDNQLIPYMQMYNEKTGKNITLGEFKVLMLRKLSNEGNIRSLSLGSNFYLVGAVKYYMNGDLTNNKDLSIFSTDANASDDWNTDICARVNALIIILRNSYIDSVGTEWEQPEDFGKYSLEKLLKKYDKKIVSLIKKAAPEPAEVNTVYKPSGDYDYDIVYSYNVSSKYMKATSPGAWCITYNSQFLKSYTKAGNGHFVIFKKKGWEDVKREPQKEKWIYTRPGGLPKPQDDYGNSLIAYLQSNDNPGPADYHGAPLITSRWNHGYGNVTVEADRAYTQEEFERITGISDTDLREIYEQWRNNKDKEVVEKKQNTKITKDIIRAVKYIQMRINGGENPANLLSNYNPNEVCPVTCRLDNIDVSFIIDKRKIFFETITTGTINIDEVWEKIAGIVPCKVFYVGSDDSGFLIFSTRTHSLVEIDGFYKFKSLPYVYDINNNLLGPNSLIEVAVGRRERVLLKVKNLEPLVLPNGSVWFSSVYNSAEARRMGFNNITVNEQFDTHFMFKGLAEIVYDESSGEKFFYDLEKCQFIEMPKFGGNTKPFLCCSFSLNDNSYPIMYMSRSVIPANYRVYQAHAGFDFLVKDGRILEKTVNIDGVTYCLGSNEMAPNLKPIPFRDISQINESPKILRFVIDKLIGGKRYLDKVLYDVEADKIIQNPDTGKDLHVDFLPGADRERFKIRDNLMAINMGGAYNSHDRYIYMLNEKRFLKCPKDILNLESEYYFGILNADDLGGHYFHMADAPYKINTITGELEREG